ncbi:MAG TPA: amino acid ABC transporter substrate-binding protein [Puia sp.]|nr:amino acid ABC transporter substrate-binding protein [Puia sp.]
MKKHIRYSLLLLSCSFSMALSVRAQVDTARHLFDTTRHLVDTTQREPDTSRVKLAIFAPLYLDSAFDANGNYRYDKSFPRFMSQGLEFYEGAQLALDTLAKEHVQLDVQIYDTRNAKETLQQMLDDSSMEHVSLIIGEVSNTGELRQLAAAAQKKNVPFIDANFPNDGGITNNPSLVILNSTLRTHCEGIYRYLQRNYATKSLVFFRKNGAQEDRLKGYFTELDKKTAGVPLQIKYVTLDDNFSAPDVAAALDSMTLTVCIAGSLDDAFGMRLCQLLAGLKSYQTKVIGMPTWDNLDWAKPDYSGEDIVYTTPFYINPQDTLVKSIQQVFTTRFYARPSDMVFRGYETVYRFGHLLVLHGKNLSGSIGENKFKVFTDFEIQPVFLNRQTMTLDYFENKKLYFIKNLNGTTMAVN